MTFKGKVVTLDNFVLGRICMILPGLPCSQTRPNTRTDASVQKHVVWVRFGLVIYRLYEGNFSHATEGSCYSRQTKPRPDLALGNNKLGYLLLHPN